MIVIDTSALIALLKNERDATACRESLKEANEIAISASTLTEALIVSAGQKLREEMVELISSVVTTTFDVTSLRAAHAAAAYSRWGKGIHPAGLNFGDCFAYARAAELDCPLLFVGDDFARTDIRSAIPRLITPRPQQNL